GSPAALGELQRPLLALADPLGAEVLGHEVALLLLRAPAGELLGELLVGEVGKDLLRSPIGEVMGSRLHGAS
ncbi:MAG: hypothetical protein ACRCZP_06025, partial [Phycicoccus sp.]